MLRYNKNILFLFCALPICTYGQKIDNTLSYKNINTDKYFRLNYENDFFSATDIYYTQGINIELIAPSIKSFFLTKLLIHPSNKYTRYGIGLEHNGYTPTSIQQDTILYGDRPFAACFMLKTFQLSIDSIHSSRLSSAFYLGVIGQAAVGAEMQTGIHRWLNNITPHGWIYQIHNDIILNYQVDYEKQIFSYANLLSIDIDGIARVGTLNDNAGLGTTIIIGYFDNPYKTVIAEKNHFRFYAYEHAEINLVGYDATLQGGLFDHSSPYTIVANNITRATFENRFGFVISYKHVFLEYFQSFLSPEFSTGKYHVWGGIQLAFGF